MIEIIQPHEVAGAIAEQQVSREYRPTAMILGGTILDPYSGFISFVTIVSSKEGRPDEPNLWWFPQGGLEMGETPEKAASRELGEEIKKGLKPTAPENFAVLGALKSDQKLRKPDDEKWSKGKLLIACFAPVVLTNGREGIEPNPEENIAKAALFSEFTLRLLFRQTKNLAPQKDPKAEFSLAMMAKAIELLRNPAA